MLKKLFFSALFGLFCAGIILVWQYSNQIFQSQTEPLSFKNAVRIASPAVVNVYNRAFSRHQVDQFGADNLGSGVIMSKDGYILTNKHVIERAEQIVVALQNGQYFDANLVGFDSLTDLAVLKIRADNLATIPQNPQRKHYVGDVVLAIGNPYNLGQSVSKGIISALGRNTVGEFVGRQNFIQTDASINRGNSGGALINSVGELIGINTLSIGKSSNEVAEGLNFAIPIELANDIMAKIIRDGRVIRGYFGVQSDFFNNPQRLETGSGILIVDVSLNSPAEKAGIKVGDIILKIGDVDAISPTQVVQQISNIRPNTKVEVLISRLGQKIIIPVIIGEYPIDEK